MSKRKISFAEPASKKLCRVKKSLFAKFASEKICRIFKRIEAIITFCRLKTYNPLSRNFNNITRWLNLTHANLSNTRVGELPAQLGTLPHLQYLDLSRSHIRFRYRYGWLWIKQAEIRKTLIYLNISYNSITALPHYIGDLNALRQLNISHNELENLPHSIGDMQSLRFLDASYNSLLCVPLEIYDRFAAGNFEMNPCLTENNPENDCVITSLKELSAAVIMQHRHRIPYRSKLPDVLIEYTDNIRIRRCAIQFCRRFCRVAYTRFVEPRYLYRQIIYQPHHVFLFKRIPRTPITVDYITCYPNCNI